MKSVIVWFAVLVLAKAYGKVCPPIPPDSTRQHISYTATYHDHHGFGCGEVAGNQVAVSNCTQYTSPCGLAKSAVGNIGNCLKAAMGGPENKLVNVTLSTNLLHVPKWYPRCDGTETGEEGETPGDEDETNCTDDCGGGAELDHENDDHDVESFAPEPEAADEPAEQIMLPPKTGEKRRGPSSNRKL